MHTPDMRRREVLRDSYGLSFWSLCGNVDAHLSNFASGSGLLLLVQLGGTSLQPGQAAAALVFGVVAAWIFAWIRGGEGRAPVWLCLWSNSVNVVFTLAVSLGLIARLCPPEGKEFILIPIYFQLCMSRLQIYLTWPNPVLGCLFIAALLIVSDSGASISPPNEYSPVSPQASFAALAVLAAYDALSQWCRLSESVFHFPSAALWRIPLPSDASCLAEVAVWALVRLAAFGLLALSRGLWGAEFLGLFLSPLPTYSTPRSFNWLTASYAGMLLLACMCMTAAWFQCLRRVVESVSRQSLPPQRLVRLQHILNALVVCAAWAFPIENGELSTQLLAGVAGVTLVAAVVWATQKNVAH